MKTLVKAAVLFMLSTCTFQVQANFIYKNDFGGPLVYIVCADNNGNTLWTECIGNGQMTAGEWEYFSCKCTNPETIRDWTYAAQPIDLYTVQDFVSQVLEGYTYRISYIDPVLFSGFTLVDPKYGEHCIVHRESNPGSDNEAGTAVYTLPNLNLIVLNKNRSSNISSVKLFDLSGREVVSDFNINQNEFELSTAMINKGIYIIIVTTDLGEYRTRILVSR